MLESITRHQWISEAAYYKAEARGFYPGHALLDWLEAEKDFSVRLVSLYIATLQEDGVLTLVSLQKLAEAIGVHDPQSLGSETALIHAIQIACRQHPCFRVEYQRLVKTAIAGGALSVEN